MYFLIRRFAAVLAALACLVAIAQPASARFVPGQLPVPLDPNAAMLLDAITGPGQNYGGFYAPSDFDPLSGYPEPNYNTTGFTPTATSFGGVIRGTTAEGETLELYCIDRAVETGPGVPYDPSTWELSQVPNLGYVLRILTNYFPATDQPANATSDNQRAAAVQAAIWFFTSNFVLAPSDPRFALTSQIVSAVLAAGPLPEPAPNLSVTGPANVTAGSLAGPFTIQNNVPEATLSVTGATLYSDPEGQNPILNGSLYPTNTPFWLRSDTPGAARIEATATVLNPIGRAFLHAPVDEENPEPAGAQALILAEPGEVRTTAEANVTVNEPPDGEKPPHHPWKPPHHDHGWTKPHEKPDQSAKTQKALHLTP